jgi:hypothetical protein
MEFFYEDQYDHMESQTEENGTSRAGSHRVSIKKYKL